MKLIPLTRGLFTKVDDEDFKKFATKRWYAQKGTNAFYAARKNKKMYFLHREILNAPPDRYVDHINHDTLDNRKVNLRLCTNNENQLNRGSEKSNRSGFKGVSKLSKKLLFQNRRKHWRARVKIHGKTFEMMSFKTAKEAALAYDMAAYQLHGEFANPNFGVKNGLFNLTPMAWCFQ